MTTPAIMSGTAHMVGAIQKPIAAITGSNTPHKAAKTPREMTVNLSSQGFLNNLRRPGELGPDIMMDHFPYSHPAQANSGASPCSYTIKTKVITISRSFRLAFATVNREPLFLKAFAVSAMLQMRKREV